MKPRPDHFLSEDNISHDGEIFDYIKELHAYLWRFARTVSPGASGTLDDFLDTAVERAEKDAVPYDRLEQAERERDGALERAEYTLDQLATARFDLMRLRRAIAELLV